MGAAEKRKRDIINLRETIEHCEKAIRDADAGNADSVELESDPVTVSFDNGRTMPYADCKRDLAEAKVLLAGATAKAERYRLGTRVGAGGDIDDIDAPATGVTGATGAGDGGGRGAASPHFTACTAFQPLCFVTCV